MKANDRRRYKNPSFLKVLGARCRKLRIKNGYSIDRMSKEGEQLSPGAIQRLETGEADVQITILLRYAEVLKVPLVKLLDFPHQDVQSQILSKEDYPKKPAGTVRYYPLEIAAGLFEQESSELDFTGWVAVSKKGLSDDYFASHVFGSSMEPTIPSGSLCLFKKYTGGSRNGKIMLVQGAGLKDPELGYRFVVKKYERQQKVSEDQNRSHVQIKLISDNKAFKPILLTLEDESSVSTPALFVQVIPPLES